MKCVLSLCFYDLEQAKDDAEEARNDAEGWKQSLSGIK